MKEGLGHHRGLTERERERGEESETETETQEDKETVIESIETDDTMK